jgi:PAS domain S-box-containing protein
VSELDPKIKREAEELAAGRPDSMVGVFLVTSGNYLWASASHLVIMGYKPSDLIGHSLREFVHPGDLQHTMLGLMDAVLHGKSIELGVRLVHKSGRPLRVRATARHLVIKPGHALIIGLATPVDE